MPAGRWCGSSWTPKRTEPRRRCDDGPGRHRDRTGSAFAQQVEVARKEGYSGLMVVADNDWLLPLDLSVDEVVSFELLLDRCIGGLGPPSCAPTAGRRSV